MTQSPPNSTEISTPILMLEWWKPIVGYEGIYEISNVGNVRRIKYLSNRKGSRTIGNYLVTPLNIEGYPRIQLCTNATPLWHFVHCMIAEAFIGPCNLGEEVHHKDNAPFNRRLSNLEYLSHSENILRNGDYNAEHFGTRNLAAKLRDVQVIEILLARGKSSAQSLALKYKVSKPNIYAIWRGDIWGWVMADSIPRSERRVLKKRQAERAAIAHGHSCSNGSISSVSML